LWLSLKSISINQKKNGWFIPVYTHLKKLNETQMAISGFIVTNKAIDFTNIKFNLELNKTIVCEIRKGKSFSLKGHIFSYEFEYVPFAKEKFDKKTNSWSPRIYAGSLVKFIFYDEDGNGEFESRYNSWKIPLHFLIG
jgi:hypothetical protein